jgi:hypothetical protein
VSLNTITISLTHNYPLPQKLIPAILVATYVSLEPGGTYDQYACLILTPYISKYLSFLIFTSTLSIHFIKNNVLKNQIYTYTILYNKSYYILIF